MNEFHRIRVSEKGIYELSGISPFGVDAKNISKVVLKQEYSIKNRISGIIIGLLLCFVGIFGFTPIVLWIRNGGVLMMDETFGLLIFLLLGSWLIYNALNKEIFLLIYTNKDPVKLVFRGCKNLEDAHEFLEKACEKHHYPYELITRS